MRGCRAAGVVAMGILFSSASLRAEGGLLVTPGKPQKIKFGKAQPILAGVIRPGDKREVESRISEVKLQPVDESLGIEWAGSDLRFTAKDGSHGKAYTAVVTYRMTLEVAVRAGNRTAWRAAGVTEERTTSLPVGVLLPKLPETILVPGASQELPLPASTVLSKASSSNIHVATIDTRGPKSFHITGKKKGKATLKVKYSLLGKEFITEGKVEVLERGIQVPLAAAPGAIAPLMAADVARIAQLEGKFLSLAQSADPKLCRMVFEEDVIRVTGVSPGVTSAVFVYGEKSKERIRVEIRIAVGPPRSS
jgi:hypothetical protein